MGINPESTASHCLVSILATFTDSMYVCTYKSRGGNKSHKKVFKKNNLRCQPRGGGKERKANRRNYLKENTDTEIHGPGPQSLLMPTKYRRPNLLGEHPSLQIHSNKGPGTDCRPKTRGLRETGCRPETESCRQTATRRFDPE